MSTCNETNPKSGSDDRDKAARLVYVGLDVHKLSISLAGLCEGKWVLERAFATTDLTELRKALKKLKQLFGEVLVCMVGVGVEINEHKIVPLRCVEGEVLHEAGLAGMLLRCCASIWINLP